MKRIAYLFLSLSAFGLAVWAFQTFNSKSRQPDSDFGFRFEFGSCHTDVLDTFEGEFTQDRMVEPGITIPFQLSESQMVEIYRKMMTIRFFDYPEEFVIANPVGIETPANEYFIIVKNGGKVKSIHWIDDYFNPTNRQSVKLDELFTMIMQMIWDHPEYKKLPPLKGGCL